MAPSRRNDTDLSACRVLPNLLNVCRSKKIRIFKAVEFNIDASVRDPNLPPTKMENITGVSSRHPCLN